MSVNAVDTMLSYSIVRGANTFSRYPLFPQKSLPERAKSIIAIPHFNKNRVRALCRGTRLNNMQQSPPLAMQKRRSILRATRI